MADSEIRIGRVSSVNYETGMARITYRDKDETVTSEFPMVNYNDEYKMPQIGQQVLVAHLSNGSSRGAVIGPVWNQKYAPKETGKDLYRKDLSAEKDAAYIRYSDETGEYLVKVANIHINGVNKTILDGPYVEIAANISLKLETDRLEMDVPELLAQGGESGKINAKIKADVQLDMEEHLLDAVAQKIALKLIENLELQAGTTIKLEAEESTELQAGQGMKLQAGEGLEMEAGEDARISASGGLKLHGDGAVEISTGSQLRLSDGTYSVTLAEIMEKLASI